MSNLVGIGRFIFGLLGHVKAQKCEYLKEYIRLVIQKYDF
jgi:hypothetical protein